MPKRRLSAAFAGRMLGEPLLLDSDRRRCKKEQQQQNDEKETIASSSSQSDPSTQVSNTREPHPAKGPRASSVACKVRRWIGRDMEELDLRNGEVDMLVAEQSVATKLEQNDIAADHAGDPESSNTRYSTQLGEQQKGNYEREKKRILSELPTSIKARFGEIGFAKWSKQFFPAVIANPFHAPPDNGRFSWLTMFHQRKMDHQPLDKTPFLVYWYGESNETRHWSIVHQSDFVGFDKAPAKVMKKFKNTVTKAEEKEATGGRLSVEKACTLQAWREMQEDFEKEPSQRRRGLIGLKGSEQRELAMEHQEEANKELCQSKSVTNENVERKENPDYPPPCTISFGRQETNAARGIDFGRGGEPCTPPRSSRRKAKKLCETSDRKPCGNISNVSSSSAGDTVDHTRTYSLYSQHANRSAVYIRQREHQSKANPLGTALGTRLINAAYFSERDSNHVLTIDIPGVNTNDVIIAVNGSKLTIRADRLYNNHKVAGYAWDIDMNLKSMDDSKIKASLINGVLTIIIAKRRLVQLSLSPVVGDPPRETRNHTQFFSLSVDIPGVKPEDIQVSVTELDKVKVKARRKVDDSFSQINRVFPINDVKIDLSNVQLFLNFGVLTMVAPLKEDSPDSCVARTILVQSTDILDVSSMCEI